MLRKFAAVVGVAVGTASLLAVSVAHALGLGDITPGSGLNQPLKAEIELVSLRGVSPGEIKATMAPVEEFERAGIERSYALNDLKLVVEGTANGEAVIRLRTNEAVREPFLNFIVELNWPSGRLLREYTLLLDPPTFAEEAPVPVSRPRPATPVASSGTVSSVAEPVVSESPAPVQDNSLAGSNSYGPVGSSDTLWSIASRVRPSDSVTVQQTLVAIFKANPQAFSNNNPNQMRAGETLRIPSQEDIAAVPHRRALAEFVSAGAVVETGRRSGGSGASSTGSGRLTLAAPPEQYSTGKGGTSREAAEVLNQENEALRGEIGKLVDKNQKLEKLVQLKDQQLASVSGKSPSTVAMDSPSEVPATTEPAPLATPDSSGTSPETTVVADTTTEQVVEKPKKEKPKKKPTTPSKPEETSFLTDLLGENALVILLGLLGVIALVVGFLVYKRRQVAEENFHEALLPMDGSDDSPMRLDDSFDLPEVGEDFLAPPPAPTSANIGSSTNTSGSQEVVADPLGESDIYIAYGKYEQAEQLLTRALQDQPNRHELRVKLLECYAEMQDQNKFRDQVAMFQDALDSDPQLAKQVEKLQQRAWPKDSFSNRTAPQPIPSADDIFGSSASASAAPKESDWAPARKQSVADTFDNDGEFALDLDTDLSSTSKASEPATMAEDPSLDDSEFSFDLDETPALNKTAASDWQPEQEPASSFNLDDMDSDMQSGDELGMGDIDEIATKLDLARAYIEMHEADGAKEILQEVMAEGNAQQKQEAQALLAKL